MRGRGEAQASIESEAGLLTRETKHLYGQRDPDELNGCPKHPEERL